LQVSLVGKAATLCLLYAFPLLFLGDHPGWGGTLARVLGWAFATWGTALYWWAAILYLAQVRSLVGNAASPLSDKCVLDSACDGVRIMAETGKESRNH
ncbi:MAG: hypothetical protein ACRDOE_16025, partial [Streptosporangiaceae bacterium]